MAFKTNVMRIFDKLKIEYKVHSYADTEAISGVEVAETLGQNPLQVFKTLVTKGKSGNHFVFMIPVSLIQIFLKGFRIGFTISYFIGIYSFKGAMYSFVNYFFGNLLFLPLIIFFTVYCIKHSVRHSKTSRKNFFEFNSLAVYAACVFGGLILSLFDSYIMSSVLKAAAAVNL